MYTGRRRKYYSKKYYRNRLFAPSMMKANMPNYYQMKGRVIQQSPVRIKEPVTEIMTRDKLDEYYQKLVQFKYKFPTHIVNPDAFFYHFNTTTITLLSLGETCEFNADNIYSNFVSSIISQLPAAPVNYHYIFNVTYITFSRGYFPMEDTSRFNFNWDASILQAQQLAIISKTQDSTIEQSVQLPVLAVSTGTSNIMRVARLGYTSGNVTFTFSNQNTNDQVTTDNGFYPLITNDSQSEIYGAKITYTTETVQAPSFIQTFIAFGIDIILKNDFI